MAIGVYTDRPPRCSSLSRGWIRTFSMERLYGYSSGSPNMHWTYTFSLLQSFKNGEPKSCVE